MTNTEFVYTTFIKASQEKVWSAITNEEFTKQYWGCALVSDWKQGSKWHSVVNVNGVRNMAGEILESFPPTRLSYSWHLPDKSSESDTSRVTFVLETIKDVVKLTVIHDKLQQGSVMAQNISQGWPLVLSSLKSFLETNEALDIWAIKTPCSTESSDSETAKKEKVAL